MGYTREAATRYAFLLAIPAVLISGLYEATQDRRPVRPSPWGPTILATVIAFGVGYAVIAWLIRYAQHEVLPAVRDLPDHGRHPAPGPAGRRRAHGVAPG